MNKPTIYICAIRLQTAKIVKKRHATLIFATLLAFDRRAIYCTVLIGECSCTVGNRDYNSYTIDFTL